MLHQAFPAFVLMMRSNAIQPNDTCNSLYTYAPSTTFCLHTRHILLLQYTNRYITVSSTFFTKSKYYSFYSPNVIFFISFLHISQHFLYYYIFRVANYFLNRYVTVQTPVNFNNYKYPSERTIKIQTVNVTEDNNVVATIMLDVSTPSFFIFFAII